MNECMRGCDSIAHVIRNYLLSEEEGGMDEEDSIMQRRRGSSVSVTKVSHVMCNGLCDWSRLGCV